MSSINIITSTIAINERYGSDALLRNNIIAYITSDRTDTFYLQVKFSERDDWFDLTDSIGQIALTLAANEAKSIADLSLFGIHAIRPVADGDVAEQTTVRFITMEVE